jgi:threonine synthase
MAFSSANSINWGRLVPQVVYYVSAYCDLIKNEQIKPGDAINICVPTGNFGNILAAYYAKQMGVPVKTLLCASNSNNVLTDFINTGVYDRRREFYTTISPSMDILISSNLERLLYDLTGRDDTAIRSWYASLAEKGCFEVDEAVKSRLHESFYAGFCDDAQTKETIADIFARYSYLLDPHTAVAVRVYEDYRRQTGDETKTLVASTANPYKFSASVLGALTDEIPADEYAQMDALERLSGMEIPEQLAALREKDVRFSGAVAKDAIAGAVEKILGL